MSGLILSLCDDSGAWVKPYRAAGYQVRTVDLKRGEDVRLMYKPSETVIGILAAPPCTMFAVSGNRWKRSEDDYREALSVVDACLRIVASCRDTLEFWCLENPIGTLVRWIGKPRCYVHPWYYSRLSGRHEHHTKKTALWGDFRIPARSPLSGEPKPFAGWTNLGGKSERTKALRSLTPSGFAEAFFRANDPLNLWRRI